MIKSDGLIVTLNCFNEYLLFRSNLEKKSSKVFDMTGFDPQISELTENGAWCWFADPRAIYFKGTVCRFTLDLLAPDPFRIMLSKGGSL